MKRDEQLLTTTEAATILGKSPRTVARMAEAGQLPAAHRLPGRNGANLFRRSVVEALAKKLSVRLCAACGQRLPKEQRPDSDVA